VKHLFSWVRQASVLGALALSAILSQDALAALGVAPIFGNNMVLQRGASVPVFGTGDVGSTVTVSFANQTASTVVPSTGKWQVNLASMSASASPATMTVSATGSSAVTFTGVQVGEVILFSGQSNMDMMMSEADESAPYISDAPNRNIRLFLMKSGNGPATASWQPANATTAANFSAVGYWAGLELSKKLNVPVGLIQATHDGTNISEWQTTNGGAGADYLAMVKPIQPYAIKAIGWYQGESNGGDAAYETKLTAMINQWRTDWGSVLPFGIVQLPAAKWEAARSAQYRVSQNVGSTFLVVTSDLPQSTQLHPTVKKPVGLRMGIGLRGFVYGEPIEYSGPVPSASPASFASGNKIVLNFTHLGNGLITSNGLAPATFQIAGADGRFQSATAVIVGNTIEVSSSRVAAPKKVRYAYGGAGNLFNNVSVPVEGGTATLTRLPASLFEVSVP
jgi:sialate O-acetylesterase